MKACAYIVGPDDGPAAALRDLARKVGFEAVQPFRSIPAAEQQAQQTPLIFFLFSAVKDPARIKPVTEAVRTSAMPRIRFAPLIYFSESPSLETIRACIGMGFDDVITLPFTLARIEERLERQLERPLVYYETPTYFGPDRRGRLSIEDEHSDRGKGGHHRRLEIMRSVGMGVSLIREDVHILS